MMGTTLIKISKIKPNPDNPRLVKDDKFQKLVKSIQEFPKMMELRPIIANDDMMILGGNMRLKACIEAGWKKVPYDIFTRAMSVEMNKKAKETKTYKEHCNEFIIKDNIGYGEDDWDILQTDWDIEQLIEWGMEVPLWAIEPNEDELTEDEKNKAAVLKITFTSPEQLQEAENDIQELIDRKYSGAHYTVQAGEL